MDDEAVFTRIFDYAPLMMIVMDEERRIHKANRAAVDFLRRPMGEMIGLRGGSVFGCLNSLEDERGCGFGPHCSVCVIRNSVLSTYRSGENQYRLQAIIPVASDDKEGELSLLISTAMVQLSGEKYVLVCLENITELKRIEGSLAQRNDQLRLLSSILRHDMTNSFMVLYSALFLTKEKYGGTMDAQTKKLFENGFATIEISKKLLQRIKELEQTIPSESELKAVDIREIAVELQRKYPIEMTVNGGGLALANEALSSVFDNVISNAIEHGKANKVEASIVMKGDDCEIRIADDGIGIPEKNKSRIFDKGFTFGAQGHTGLGLYIVKTVVEGYGGRVWVEDNVPKGTVFIIALKTPRKPVKS